MATPFNKVNPGDLISAEHMNALLGTVELLEKRVAALEAAAATEELQVFQPLAGAILQVGQQIDIIGRGFRFSQGGHRVFFDDRLITTYLPGSSDNVLRVTVEAGPPPPPKEGKIMALKVANGHSLVSIPVRVMPVAAPAEGIASLTWKSMFPDPLTAGEARLLFELDPLAPIDVPTDFAVSVSSEPGGPIADFEVLDASQAPLPNRTVKGMPGQVVTPFYVKLKKPPANSFELRVVVKAGQVVGSWAKTFAVNQPAPVGDPTIELKRESTYPMEPGPAIYDPETNTITLKKPQVAVIKVAATFTQVGTYDVKAEVGAGWNRKVQYGVVNFPISSDDLKADDGAARRSVEIWVSLADANASPGRFVLTVKRTDGNVPETLEINLKAG